MNYLTSLRTSARKHRSIVCMGLDPHLPAMPRPDLPAEERVVTCFTELCERMAGTGPAPGAFKPNIGYFHCLDRPLTGDFSGSRALARVIQLIRKAFPGTPVILDAKRGDIAASSANYAREAFACWQADAVTISPLMGSDSIAPFLRWAERGKGIYILNRTSNPGAALLQNLLVIQSGSQVDSSCAPSHSRPLYREVAAAIASAARSAPGAGAVVGATNPTELQELAKVYAELEAPLLIPGVGGQGGSAAATIKILQAAGYPPELARINSSSGITHPWAKQKQAPPADWPRVCTDALARLNEEIAYEV